MIVRLEMLLGGWQDFLLHKKDMPQTKNQKRESAIIRMQSVIRRYERTINKLSSDNSYAETGRLERLSTKIRVLERDILNTRRNIQLNLK